MSNCFEARLDVAVAENRIERFGERIDTIQRELVRKLKESVLEELLVQLDLKETKNQNTEMLNRNAMKSEQEGIENIRANKFVTPIFPSPKRRYTPSAVRPEFRSRFSSANSRVAHTDAPNKLIHKPTTFDGSTLWEWRV